MNTNQEKQGLLQKTGKSLVRLSKSKWFELMVVISHMVLCYEHLVLPVIRFIAAVTGQ